MPEEEKDGLLAVEETPVENQIVEEQELLPDNEPEKVDAAKLKEEATREKDELSAELLQVKEEKESLEKRVKDNQEYISRTRNVEKVEKPLQTYSEYKEKLLAKFEDNPKDGFERFMDDIAFDRNLERKEFDRKLSEVEARAFKKAVSLDPEKGKVLQQVEALEQERPDLGNLTFDQKMEFVKLQTVKAVPAKVDTHGKAARNQDIGSDVGGSRVGGRGDRMPSWASDPEVVRGAHGHFKSKQEMIDWSDPQKAQAMGNRMRPEG